MRPIGRSTSEVAIFQSTDDFSLISATINTISGKTIPKVPMLWKAETINAPARAPKMKVIHIDARVCIVTCVELFEESPSEFRFAE